ncbi:MAG: gluconeogenesis factor YvcK family protein [bacterium]
MVKVTVIGGGTGTYTVLMGLKKFSNLSLKAIVTATDSGGSTGRLRDEYGILPVGDIRQCMAALSENGNGNSILRKLLSYRFDKGELEGHNFGNLLLAATTNILGSEEKAIKEMSKILNIKGEVIPITNDDIDLVAEYENGDVLVGEGNIDEPNNKHDSCLRISNIRTQPKAKITQSAQDAITNSDYIILGPGDLYTSTLSNFVVDGAKEVMKRTKAKVIFIVSLMTKHGQTTNFKAQNYVDEVTKYIGKIPDYVIVNNQEMSDFVKSLYEKEEATPVEDNIDPTLKSHVIRADVGSEKIIQRNGNDNVKRSLIRHDSNKLAHVLVDIMMDN